MDGIVKKKGGGDHNFICGQVFCTVTINEYSSMMA
jgi:hypothetical protein